MLTKFILTTLAAAVPAIALTQNHTQNFSQIVQKIKDDTYNYGGDWAIKHAERIIKLVEVIADKNEYDLEIITIAAYLHDWGAYTNWKKDNIQHYDRSVEVAKEYLSNFDLSDCHINKILQCIKYHHSIKENSCIESKLFTDADALDLLGVVGFARIFAMWPKDLKNGIHWVKKWREDESKLLYFAKSKELAQKRIEETDELIRKFEEETLGLF